MPTEACQQIIQCSKIGKTSCRNSQCVRSLQCPVSCRPLQILSFLLRKCCVGGLQDCRGDFLSQSTPLLWPHTNSSAQAYCTVSAQSLLWGGTQHSSDLSLEGLHIWKLVPMQMRLDGREGPKITGHQIWAVGRLGQQIKVLLTIKGKSRHRDVDGGIIHVEHEVLVSVPIEAFPPMDGSLVADAFFEPLKDTNPVVCVDGFTPWQELQMHNAGCVEEQNCHGLVHTSIPQSLLRMHCPFGHYYTELALVSGSKAENQDSSVVMTFSMRYLLVWNCSRF